MVSHGGDSVVSAFMTGLALAGVEVEAAVAHVVVVGVVVEVVVVVASVVGGVVC